MPKLSSATEFSTFLEDLNQRGDLEATEYEAVTEQLDSQEVLNLVKLTAKLEIAYLLIAFPAAVAISIDDAQQLREDPQALLLETITFVAAIKLFRSIIAFYLANKINLPQKKLFALLEAIPHVGRLTPAVWLAKYNFKLGELFYTHHKVKKIRRRASRTDDPTEKEDLLAQEKAKIEKQTKAFKKLHNFSDRIGSLLSRN